MFVSVVIPTRNRSDYLTLCLRALRVEMGDRSDAEVIVVDDGSTQTALALNRTVCEEHAARLVEHSVNHGMAVGRNSGFRASSGQWVVFVDDDVCVSRGWYAALIECIGRHEKLGTVAIEGKILPSGGGLWDKEVQNIRGGLCLSSHIVYRSDTFRRLGGFDEHFEHEGPFCEDHELAARALCWGEIVFEPSLVATHQPRTVRLLSYLTTATRRIRQLLNAEFYFFRKQPHRYHLFRHARHFFGTYRTVLLKHPFIEFKRRTIGLILRHPLQSAVLLLALLVEQAKAWTMAPGFALAYRRRPDLCDCASHIDWASTTRLWGASPSIRHDLFRLRGGLVRSVLFALRQKPVYESSSVIRRIVAKAPSPQKRLLLRIDDVFLGMPEQVEELCALCARHRIPFLAAVTGNDLIYRDHARLVDVIVGSGGTIGVHGFTHEGRFGPFQSEILQMTYPSIEQQVSGIRKCLGERGMVAEAFVPPWNAISWDQVMFLSRLFPIVCGGPESARFTGRLFGPVALRDRPCWYVPSFYPFYGSAKDLRESKGFSVVDKCGGVACVTVHMPVEAHDHFAALDSLLGAHRHLFGSWALANAQEGERKT